MLQRGRAYYRCLCQRPLSITRLITTTAFPLRLRHAQKPAPHIEICCPIPRQVQNYAMWGAYQLPGPWKMSVKGSGKQRQLYEILKIGVTQIWVKTQNPNQPRRRCSEICHHHVDAGKEIFSAGVSSKNRRGDCLTKTGESKKNAIIILPNHSGIFQTVAQSMLMWVLKHFCSVSHGPAPGMLNL